MNPTPIHFLCTIMMGVVYWACVVVCTVCFIANIFLIVVQWSIATFINLSITTRYAVISDFIILLDRYAIYAKGTDFKYLEVIREAYLRRKSLGTLGFSAIRMNASYSVQRWSVEWQPIDFRAQVVLLPGNL